jgi:tetratricopeptide (TPR) repeat protein
MRFVLLALSVLVLAGPAAASAPAPQASHVLDGLFAKLGKASSSDAAMPIEKEILTGFLQSGSASVDLLMTRAEALLEAGDADTATKILNDVTSIAPDYAEGWHQRGKLEAQSGKDEAAMVSLQKTVTLNPREFQALMELGDMLAQYGAKPAALASYKKALALDPQLEGLQRRVDELARDVEGEKI